MLSNFLSHSYTDALIDKNFAEWHLGIPYYGFWAIMIEAPEHLNLIAKAQHHLQNFFLPNYSRQAHITLNACGLMSERFFSKHDLDKQIRAIESMNLSPFNISLSHIDSFTTAAYINISDNCNSLNKLNQVLSNTANDSNPIRYEPHITLGLYRKKFATKMVSEKIQQFEAFTLPAITIREIQFCRYETAFIQGPVEIMERIQFS